jgi:hypothetical protein
MMDLPPLPRLPRSRWFPRELAIPLASLRQPEIVMLRRLVGAHLTEMPIDVVMSMRFSRARRIFARDRAIGTTTWRTLVATCWYRQWIEVVAPAWASIPSRIAFADLVANLGPAASRPARACFAWLRDELPRYRCHEAVSRLVIALMRAVIANGRKETAREVTHLISEWSLRSRAICERRCDVIPALIGQLRRRFRADERDHLGDHLARFVDDHPDPTKHLVADALLFDLGRDSPAAIRHARRLVTGMVATEEPIPWLHSFPETDFFRWVNRLSWSNRFIAFRDEVVMAGVMSLAMTGRVPSTRDEPGIIVSNDERESIISKSSRILGKVSAVLVGSP